MVYVYIQHISDYNRIAADKYDIKNKRPATKTKKKMKEKNPLGDGGWPTDPALGFISSSRPHPR